ncbi:MAG TPA: response regulator transcription factor [Myxococcales bacterium]|nr:response regulator transcription factor [Myxococcales bacterium]
MGYRVVVVDDHAVFRECLAVLLKPQPDIEVVGEASHLDEALEVVARTAPDVIIVDIKLGHLDGIAVVREFLRRDPQARILMLTMVDEPAFAAGAFAAGALGYATKSDSSEEVAHAVRCVAERRRYLSRVLSPAAVESEREIPGQAGADPLAALTRREREVFDLTLTGATSGEIGRKLSISARTVETHRGRILHKLHARTTLDLVRLAAKLGLLEAPAAAAGAPGPSRSRIS